MDISFDPAKRAVTLKERGLDFADAGLVFMADVATRQDVRHDYGEDRFVSAGYLRGRMVVMVWDTVRQRQTHNLNEALSWKRRKALAAPNGLTRTMRPN